MSKQDKSPFDTTGKTCEGRLRIGFYSAVVVASFLIYSLAMTLLPLNVFSVGQFLGNIYAVAWPISVFLLFMSTSCIFRAHHRFYSRGCMLFALLYALCTYITMAVVYLPQDAYNADSVIQGWYGATRVLQHASLGFASLFAVLASSGSRLDSAIRVALAVIGVFSLFGSSAIVLGYILVNSPAGFAYFAEEIVLPIAALLLAVRFHNDIRRRVPSDFDVAA